MSTCEAEREPGPVGVVVDSAAEAEGSTSVSLVGVLRVEVEVDECTDG
jgi:hypothetical protein